MNLKDIGPQPQSFDLEQATRDNKNYRTVVWSGRYLQVTLMSIPAGSDIGLEMHAETDQFLRLDAGRGRVQMGPSKDRLTFDKEVSDGRNGSYPRLRPPSSRQPSELSTENSFGPCYMK